MKFGEPSQSPGKPVIATLAFQDGKFPSVKMGEAADKSSTVAREQAGIANDTAKQTIDNQIRG